MRIVPNYLCVLYFIVKKNEAFNSKIYYIFNINRLIINKIYKIKICIGKLAL